MAGASTFQARGVPDEALNKPRAVSMGPTRLQIANRVNGANHAKRLALLLTSKPFGKR